MKAEELFKLKDNVTGKVDVNSSQNEVLKLLFMTEQ